jgi:uncharacterized repeat protein (TIGR03803 family)
MHQTEPPDSGVRTRLPAIGWRRLGILCVLSCIPTMPLPAQGTFTSLHYFCQSNNCPDGSSPYAGLVQGLDGNLYGTTEYGGVLTCTTGCGTVFRITPTGTFTELYEFCSVGKYCADGATPTAGLILGTDGNLYGTTVYGGNSPFSCGATGAGGCGTVFKITPSGTLTTLYSFCPLNNCTDGDEPYGGLVQAIDGNFYGTTTYGGAAVGSSGGTVFRITPGGTMTTLYSFCTLGGCADGENPHDALIQGSDGNLYGTTLAGGANQVYGGAVFKINPRGPMTTMYSFCSLSKCPDGSQPNGGLIQATDGNFYGTASSGGSGNYGTIFKITPGDTLTTIYDFCSLAYCADGAYPYDPLVQATDGNLYGTTGTGGSVDGGTAFTITTAGAMTVLFDFSFNSHTDGSHPQGPLLQGTDGIFYGTTSGGGNSQGNVFSLNEGLSASVKAEPNFGRVGAMIAILGTGLTGAESVSFNGTAVDSFEIASDSEIVTTVPAGATTGTIEVGTTGGSLSSAVNFRVLPCVTAVGLTTNFAGGGAGDVAVWRADTSSWYVKPASGGPTFSVLQGLPGDIPVTGDYDGDGKSDYGLWRPSNGTFYVILSSTAATVTKQWGTAGDVPVPSDYDGDGKTDFAVWRPSNATWYIIPSGGGPNITFQWGATADVPVVGDYDGDGKADFAVWRPSNGTWYVSLSGGGILTQAWGAVGDIPVEGDYDGDGMTDFAVWRPWTGSWYIMPSSGIGNISQQYGTIGDIPVVGDYNGDGKYDYAVWRPSNGTWYMNYSSGGTKSVQWGATGDLPATHLPLMYRRNRHTANFDGDRKTDVAVFRPSNGTWYEVLSGTGKSTSQSWGMAGDIIVPGDYDGDGKTDCAVWRPSTATFYVIPSSAPTTRLNQQLGTSAATPVPGDYDGDGKTDFAVWQSSTGTFTVILSSTGKTVTQRFGTAGDIPVPGDYDGDGKTDYALWRPSNGTFYVILSSTGQSVNQQWGLNGDKPVPGDYDGDGRTDYAVWRPSNGTFYVIQSSTGKSVTQQWGTSGDVPVPKDYDGDEKTDFAVWRPSNGTWYIINSSTGKSTPTAWGASGDVPVNKPTGQ